MHHHLSASQHVQLSGLHISTYSRDLVQRLASMAKLHVVHVTSVHRSVPDQARIFFQKHVIEKKPAKYKNSQVSAIVAHARNLHANGSLDQDVQAYLVRAIEHVRGGPGSVSRHLAGGPFLEVFDIAHYSGPTKGPGRHNYMDEAQARAFLEGCRGLMPNPISRLGHSAELGFKMPLYEFPDEKCFHLEILQPFDGLEVDSPTRFA